MGDKDILLPKLLLSREQYQNSFLREELRTYQSPLPKMKFISVGPRCSFSISNDNVVYRWGHVLGGNTDIEFPYIYIIYSEVFQRFENNEIINISVGENHALALTGIIILYI